LVQSKETNVQVQSGIPTYENDYDVVSKSVEISNRSRYQNLATEVTQEIVLIGHTDAIEPYGIKKISSIQEGINILRADFNSPLLRGLFDAYSCGARDIWIMSCGYMSEYISDINNRNTKIFLSNSSTANTYSFYELYYQRLVKCYEILKDYEMIDIIVPLETSILNTGNVNFVKQLAQHCHDFQTKTGEVAIGIIGSRTRRN